MCRTLPEIILQNLGRKIPIKKIFLDPSAVLCCPGGQIANFIKKMHFSGKKCHFFEKFILYKIYQWPKIHFFSGQKYFFVVPSKVSIFHQILPRYGTPCSSEAYLVWKKRAPNMRLVHSTMKTTSNIANMSAQARVKLQLLVLAQPPVRINPLEVLVWHHD